MVEEILVSKAIELAISEGNKFLRETDFELISKNEEIEESLNHHLRIVKNWAKEVSFDDSNKAKSINNIYINLDLSVFPRKKLLEGYDNVTTFKFNELPLDNHIVILGQPGAGKTTSLKYLTYNMLFEENNTFKDQNYSYPVLLKFRELNNFNSKHFLLNNLINIYGIDLRHKEPTKYKDSKSESYNNYENVALKHIQKFIDPQRIVLILDGFDELPNNKVKENAINSIRLLSASLDNSIIILSSRSSDFNYHISGTKEYEIAPLTDKQIKSFSVKWLNSENKGRYFFYEIKESPFYDTTIRPLTIAHLCAIYERRGDIPKKPKTIYKKLINLLLEEWDLQRSIKRSSQYANFEIDRKFDFLSELSYEITTYFGKSVFSTTELNRVYNHIHTNFGLPRHQSSKVVKELETHTGLIIQSGYDQFEFAHKSLQEYLTANYIVKLPEFPNDKSKIELLANELAISITISSNPSEYFIKFVTDFILNSDTSYPFLSTFINRLILEKPDFTHTPRLIFKSLKLYEIYITSLDLSSLNNKLRLAHAFGNLNLELVNRGEKFRNIIGQKYSNIEEKRFFYVYRKMHQYNGPKKVIIPKLF